MARVKGSSFVRHSPSLAEGADRHRLYQLGVQSAEADAALLQQVYREVRGCRARYLREDFCGTAATLRAWLRQGSGFGGEGVDIDAETLEWGRRHNFKGVRGGRGGGVDVGGGRFDVGRAVLRVGDAREVSVRAPDVRCAFNFSYWVFRERGEMLEYFRSVWEDLASGGVFVIDVHGGGEVYCEEEQVIECDGFEFVCHQTDVSPVDHSAELALHFRFADGSELRDAFRYTWRIWSLPELVDILREVGFVDVRCYWCVDEGEGTRYELTRVGYNDDAWVACLVGVR